MDFQNFLGQSSWGDNQTGNAGCIPNTMPYQQNGGMPYQQGYGDAPYQQGYGGMPYQQPIHISRSAALQELQEQIHQNPPYVYPTRVVPVEDLGFASDNGKFRHACAPSGISYLSMFSYGLANGVQIPFCFCPSCGTLYYYKDFM